MSIKRKKRWEQYLETARNSRLHSVYGITVAEYQKMHIEQQGLCDICRQPESRMFNGHPRKLVVDHCHLTGEVRKLLCRSCNSALGFFKDNIETMKRAIEYVENARTRS
jgi:hypothetical protein